MDSDNGTKMVAIVADFLGILGFLFLIKREVDGAIESLRFPEELDFYFLFFWAFVAALIGGLLWNLLIRWGEAYRLMDRAPYLGGRSSEPHGKMAFLWPIATNLPLIVVLLLLNLKYEFMNAANQMVLYVAFLLGIAVGAIVFFDIPLGGHQGFRNYFEATQLSFFKKELWLAVIWTSILSASGFVLMTVGRLVFVPRPKSFWVIMEPLLKQVGLCVGLTTLAIMFFLLVFPDEPRLDTARGIIAGLFLRISLFFGLLFVRAL